MLDVTIDYDFGRRKGILTTEYLSNIREYFSVEDKNQAFHVGYICLKKMWNEHTIAQ